MRHVRGFIRAAAAPIAVGCAAAFLVTAGGAAASGSVSRSAGGGPAGTSIALGGLAGAPAANPRTDTVYVPVQSGHVVDVINAATCNALARSGCRVIARASVGNSPLAATIDEATDTLYVLNGAGTVSVVDGARCNARVTRACGRPLATIKVGALPVAAAVNPGTRTLYVANANGGSVSVINAAACNAVTTSGCGQRARTIKDAAGPDGIDVDVATDTVYAANAGTSGNGDTVSVINGATCNGHTGSGCGRAPRTVKVGGGAFWVAVDQASDTVYVPGNNDGTVSVINGARCNAVVAAGCASTPPAVTTGAEPQFVAVDAGLHTVFAINQGDDTLSAINTRTCGGTATSGCTKVPPSERATFNPPAGFNPNAFALIPRTNTAYLVNDGGADIMSVISVGGCNATRTSGCRRPAPSVPDHEYVISVDPATDTLYAGNLNQPVIDVLNGATCNARDRAGCAPVAEIPMADPQANVGAIDDTTHTLYASNPFPSSDTVAVINTATCNARHTSGCADHPPVIKIGPAPGPPAINPRTRTLYVPFGTAADRVAVVNAATCNAINTSGCTRSPGVVKVGQGTFVLAVSAATDTVYAPNAGTSASGFTDGDTVSVIDGATCNGTDHSGCGRLAATAKVGHQPVGIAVNDRTGTLYVSNNADGDLPGTVSVINGATCNGTRTTGCGRPFPTVGTGRSPEQVAVDARTGAVYVADGGSAAVSILDGSRCSASLTAGCRAATREQAVGSIPVDVTVNPRTGTVYVTQVFQSGSLSIFRTASRG